MKTHLASLTIAVVLLFGGSYAYLYPGSEALFSGRTDIVMGDGTDSASLPYGYSNLQHILETKPSRFFYGSVFTEAGDPERGGSLWIPWNERWIATLLTYVVPVEQVSTAFIFVLFLLNGAAMYALGRYLKWNRWVAIALGMAWALNAYTRARAKVHGALVGIYHVPLVFLALYLVVRGRSNRSLLAAAGLLLFSGMVAHYYVITSIFLSPFFIAFVYLQPGVREEWKLVTKRFVLAALPLVLFLGANYVFMLPPEAPMTKQESVAEEVMPDGSSHPYLKVFHAYPIDYLAGDLGLVGNTEINPLRDLVNEEIFASMNYSNSHERTNGIRWSIIALGIAAIWLFARGRFRDEAFTHRNVAYFVAFGVFGFWLSMGPEFPTETMSPSFWLYKFFPKIRVASRAGILVHFAILMLIGFLFTRDFKFKKWLAVPGVLIALFTVDYLPLKTMPMAPVYPAYSALHRDGGTCETGMVFPFINPYVTGLPYYFFAQRMRGSDCKIINATGRREEIQRVINMFPPDGNFLRQLPERPQVAEQIEKLARCMPLNWLVFIETPKEWASQVCNRLGWKMSPDQVCVAPRRDQPMQRLPSQCL